MKKILVPWDEFCVSLKWVELIKVFYTNFYRFTERKNVQFNDEHFTFYNGPIQELRILKEDNVNVERLDGRYILHYRQYDYEEDGTDWDGYPQYKKLETYTLTPCKFQFWVPN